MLSLLDLNQAPSDYFSSAKWLVNKLLHVILARIIHQSHRLALNGESMRKKNHPEK